MRAAIARLLLVARRLTLTTVMRLAAAHPHLAGDLRRLEHLTLHRARLSMWDHDIDPHFEEVDDFDTDIDPEEADGLDVNQEDDEPGHGPIDDLPELAAAVEAAVDAFANGSLPAEVPRLADWLATTLATRFPDARDDRSRILRTLDLGYLVASRPHFTALAAAADTLTRARAVEFAADLATFLASGLTPARTANRSPATPTTRNVALSSYSLTSRSAPTPHRPGRSGSRSSPSVPPPPPGWATTSARSGKPPVRRTRCQQPSPP